MNILLFGGTFDPVHYGHISLLQSAIDAVNPDKALIIPAALPPHKAAASAKKELRLEMCKAILPYIHGTAPEIEQCELMRQGSSFTIDTINELESKYPNSRFYFCLGSDMLLYFKKWRRYKELLQKLVLVVQMRTGADIAKAIDMSQSLVREGGNIIFTHTQPIVVSSTFVRESIANGDDITELVPLQIIKIINNNNLYAKEV